MTPTMTSTRARIGVIAGCLTAGFAVVLLHLWFVMVHQNEEWSRRSADNRWSFRSVPSQRGSLLDRHGRVLARDEPTMELSVYYLRFRLRHPVGAAVHGATLLASLDADGEGTRYSYADGALGPAAAAHDLLAMPARLLRRGVLPKEVSGDLARYVTTVLAACADLSAKRVFTALRKARDAEGAIAVGDVLPVPRADLLAAFGRSVDSLHALDAELQLQRRDRLMQAGLDPDEEAGLIATLDELRRDSLDGVRLKYWKDGKEVDGTPKEEVRLLFDNRIPFDLAASLRTADERHPGLEVAPSIQRIYSVQHGTALRTLLGNVADMDRAQPAEDWIDGHLQRELPGDWVEEFTPEGLADSDEERALMQEEARERYKRALLRDERRGTTGLERSFDSTLMGRLGMRLVEQDSRQREHLLWSHLRVEAGEDVALTLDLELQHLAERITRDSHAAMAAMHASEVDQKIVRAALAVIDARTGDVLAYAGAPVVPGERLPGLTWSKDGSIGSVVKPMVLVEQLESEALNRPHRPIATLQPCAGKYVFGKQRLGCASAHGDSGRDPIEALADSCNTFFFQCAEGLGAEGINRALRRFGLREPSGADDPFLACWQPSIRGLTAADPRLDQNWFVPMRAVGYGVQATPLAVARAYAAFATGALPTLGLDLGVDRPSVPFLHLASEIEVVRAGLAACVRTGTAREIRALREFEVFGKTGTAEVGKQDQNNAWFAGYLPSPGRDAQLCFCAVIYWVRDKVHGGDAAGQMVGSLLEAMRLDPLLDARYLQRESGR